MHTARMEFESTKLRIAATHVRLHMEERPQVALVLGSGLGAFAGTLQQAHSLRYADIPLMTASGVAGHAGALVFGRSQDVPVVAMQGRVHMYEGHSAADVVFGVRLMVQLGARTVILTNAAGGVNQAWKAGDLMIIEDHLNLTGHNCLQGTSDAELGERFIDMTQAYDLELRRHAQRVGKQLGLELRSGVYAGLPGPSYETPAEIRMLRTLGADVVGMSTVLETIAVRQLGARCLGISCITNMGAGLNPQPLSHMEVQETAARVEHDFIRLLEGVLTDLPADANLFEDDV